jgi:uncharacterized GH25 family protein
MKTARLPRALALAVTALVALGGLPAAAHDFWIEPERFQAQKGAILKITLRVGDFGVGDRVQRADSRIVDFSARTPDGSKPIVGRDGADPAGLVRLESDGTVVLGYRSNHASVELEPAKFADYLREKGLEPVLELRAQRGEDGLKAREIYSRCAKSIVRVGDGPSTGFDLMLGYPLELLPEKNPGDLRPSADAAALEALPVRLYFQGKPLANALVGALDLDAPKPAAGLHQEPITARTDADGRASIALPHGGRWLFAAVHMIRAENNPEAEWESFWASLTFETQKTAPATTSKG